MCVLRSPRISNTHSRSCSEQEKLAFLPEHTCQHAGFCLDSKLNSRSLQSPASCPFYVIFSFLFFFKHYLFFYLLCVESRPLPGLIGSSSSFMTLCLPLVVKRRNSNWLNPPPPLFKGVFRLFSTRKLFYRKMTQLKCHSVETASRLQANSTRPSPPRTLHSILMCLHGLLLYI